MPWHLPCVTTQQSDAPAKHSPAQRSSGHDPYSLIEKVASRCVGTPVAGPDETVVMAQ